MTARVLLLALPLLAACSRDEGFNRRSSTDVFFQAPSNAVDILWVIDGSVSMANEQANVAAGAEDFVAQLEGSGMDFHLGIVSMDVDRENAMAGALLGNPAVLTPTTPDYQAIFQETVQIGITGSDKERGLEAAVRAVSAPLTDTRNAGFMREDASLAVIFLTDENDCSDFGALSDDSTGEDCYGSEAPLVPVVEIVGMFRDVKGDQQVTLSGIIGPAQQACDDSTYGLRYETAIKLSSGVAADICQPDYTDVMGDLGLVASGIVDTFQLEHNADADTIEVSMDPDDEGEEPAATIAKDDANGWSYITEYAQVKLNGSSVPPRGARIEISYTIAPGNVEQAPDTGTTAATP